MPPILDRVRPGCTCISQTSQLFQLEPLALVPALISALIFCSGRTDFSLPFSVLAVFWEGLPTVLSQQELVCFRIKELRGVPSIFQAGVFKPGRVVFQHYVYLYAALDLASPHAHLFLYPYFSASWPLDPVKFCSSRSLLKVNEPFVNSFGWVCF